MPTIPMILHLLGMARTQTVLWNMWELMMTSIECIDCNDYAALGRVSLALVVALVLTGCKSSHEKPGEHDLEHYLDISTHVDYLDVVPHFDDAYAMVASTPRPITLANQSATNCRDMTLQEAVQLALQYSQVLRDLGGSVLRSPDTVDTIHSPAIQETDPLFGVEAALSAFDAQWSTITRFEKNDRALNNQFFGGGTRVLKQDLLNYESELTKHSAIGTEMTARNNIDYDFNNAPGNDTPNKPWAAILELEVRQPLLQGGGVDFNRIAGPDGGPGNYNGVLIARVNTDVKLADFEAGVKDFVADVETVYWELYYAYRNLDAKIAARDRALETWQVTHTWFLTGRRAGGPDREARAREQYFRLEAEVQNALSGHIQERSRATTFRGVGGIHYNERRLRLMIGLPVNGLELIRPTTEPTLAEVYFAWEDILAEAQTRRVEIRRQESQIKRRELEMTAAKNLLYPELDVFGRYRWRGLGHNLLEPNGTDRPLFNDAFQNLFDGNFQEWQFGVEFAMPIGLRQAHAAVRNAELKLHRERVVLEEQRREVTLDISNAIAEKDRAYLLAQTNLNRRLAAAQQLAATEAIHADADENQRAYLLDLLLDAQRRLGDADSQYYRSLVEYMMAIKQIHYAKGSLLEYCGVFLAESAMPQVPDRRAARGARSGRARTARHADRRMSLLRLFGPAKTSRTVNQEPLQQKLEATPDADSGTPVEPLPQPIQPSEVDASSTPTSLPILPVRRSQTDNGGWPQVDTDNSAVPNSGVVLAESAMPQVPDRRAARGARSGRARTARHADRRMWLLRLFGPANASRTVNQEPLQQKLEAAPDADSGTPVEPLPQPIQPSKVDASSTPISLPIPPVRRSQTDNGGWPDKGGWPPVDVDNGAVQDSSGGPTFSPVIHPAREPSLP